MSLFTGGDAAGMDVRKLDDAFRKLTQSLSRRSIVGTSLRGYLAAALAAIGLGEEAEARRNRRDKDRHGKGRDTGAKRHGGKKSNGKSRDANRRGGGRASGRGDDDVATEAKGANGTCTRNRTCRSRDCRKKRGRRKGRCALSRPGQGCVASTDCVPGATCVNGTCGFIS